jgi:hypothetical protein
MVSTTAKLRHLGSVIAFGTLSIRFSCAADCGGTFAGTTLRWLFIVPAKLHLAINALALQLLFQGAERLIDIVVADNDLHTKLAFEYRDICRSAITIWAAGWHAKAWACRPDLHHSLGLIRSYSIGRRELRKIRR